ncbi:acid protease [Gymnopus androsaceus JB14]|uniref:Acid protease n=1 Tax=Gymnopus androsaceus JB14 TaxID=1447944 RepID=A0A6A4I8X7_9AGAR|nr:acid protease [Gymnopus androsaceus JB14]
MVSSPSLSLFNLALLVSLSSNVLAAPSPSFPLSMNLHRRVPPQTTDEEMVAWAKAHKLNVEAKYGNPSSIRKRASGQNLIVNQGVDSSFFGSVAVGTPPVAFDVILDTGSADLWLAAPTCDDSACQGLATFDSSKSIQYGSGAAQGELGSDVVQMAGFSVQNQVFAVCDVVSTDLVEAPVSGLIGLAFQTISSSGAKPLWETLASSSAWTDPLMAFQLTRFSNASNAKSLEPGGTLTMGAVNTSLYTGDIDFNDIPGAITSQGSSISVPTGLDAQAAIDTGTTLIGGPTDAVAEIYANIPGAEQGTGDMEGYYLYPCSTNVAVTMSFGGQMTCMGAFFAIETGGGAPAWIVGDTFLKNVYSVFRYTPPSVGFAQLSATALAMNGVNSAAPTATIGSAAATATGSDSNRRRFRAGGAQLSSMGLCTER